MCRVWPLLKDSPNGEGHGRKQNAGSQKGGGGAEDHQALSTQHCLPLLLLLLPNHQNELQKSFLKEGGLSYIFAQASIQSK